MSLVQPLVKITDRKALIDWASARVSTAKTTGKHSARSVEAYLHVAIQLGLRSSDILSIQKNQVVIESPTRVSFRTIKESKTGKEQKNKAVVGLAAEKLISLIEAYPDTPFIFVSKTDAEAPMVRKTVYRTIKKAGKELGIEVNLGTHSLRKACALTAWASGMTDHDVQAMLNHSNVATTRRYTDSVKYLEEASIEVNRRLMDGEGFVDCDNLAKSIAREAIMA